MRLIDADAFKEYLKNAFEEVKHVYTDGGVFAWRITEDFCRDIDEQPTINAEPEIIRCRDCKYSQMTDDGECRFCKIWFAEEEHFLPGDYYCADAERG